MTEKDFNKIEIDDLNYIGYIKSDILYHYMIHNKSGRVLTFEFYEIEDNPRVLS